MPIGLSQIVSKALSQGCQLDPEAFSLLSTLPADFDVDVVVSRVLEKKRSSLGTKVIGREDLESVMPSDLTLSNEDSGALAASIEADVEVLRDPTNEIAPADAETGFKKLFLDRYLQLLTIAKRRPDSRNVETAGSVARIQKGGKGRITGLLSAKSSKKGNVELTLDDPSGSTKIVCRDEEVSRFALGVPLDSLVIADINRTKEGQIFASSLNFPDIPSRKPVTSSRKVYALLLSDLHVGSRMFLEDDFRRLILWLNGKLGDSDIVSRIKYVIIAGDVVDGIGIYPEQENQLLEKDVRKQYTLASELIDELPKHMQIVISPGNHDPVRQALPQPAVPTELAEPFYKMENVRLVGNPSYVKLHGVNFLIYHGRSLDDIIATVADLAYSRPAIAMRVLLRARHLAPMYGKRTALSPELRDMLVIDPVPDVLHSGHVHTIDWLDYRGTLVINSGTWQAQTPFQANMGLEPTPSIVPIVDLSTLEVTKRSFSKYGFGLAS